MKNEFLLISKVLILAAALTFSACRKNEETASILPEATYSSINEVDFKNFTYPVETGKDTFTLKNGETPFGEGKDVLFALENIEFADLTDDGADEAIIKMLSEYGRTATGLMYVYTLENRKPKILWSAAAGFNAKGGLKRLYSDNGALAVELFGKNRFIESTNKFEYSDEATASKNSYRPTAFTKFRFEWNGEKFVLEGDPELLDDDLKDKFEEFAPKKRSV